LRPFIRLVDWITPGEIDAATAGTHIAMMHTMFNLANTLVLLPFVKQYANLLERIIKSKPGEDDLAKLHYRPATLLASPELNLAQARSELAELARIADTLFTRLRSELLETNGWNPERLEYYERHCAYTTSMKEGLSKFLLEIARQDISDKTHDNISLLIRLVSDFENMCYACFSIASIKEKGSRKNMFFGEEEIQQLEPFTALTHNFLLFSKSKIGKPLSEEDLALAVDYENRVDACRSELKKLARRRIKKGSDVKAELMFIDLIRHIEKIGDNAYSVAVTLREMK
jgi:phosphate:Na+ symporter